MTANPPPVPRSYLDRLAEAELVRARAITAALHETPAITPSEWADQHRVLSSSESPQPGRWSTDRNPPMREILDCLDVRSPVTEVAFMSPIQWGKTEIANNAVGYFSSVAPGPIMMLRPTVSMCKRWSKQRLKPMISNTPVLRDLFPPEKSRDSGNTTLVKEYPGGILVMVGANAATDLSDMPVRYLLMDEVDRYPLDVDKEGSPIDLAAGRTSRFGRRKKILLISTPTVEGLSAIHRSYLEGDQRRCYVPCPHCGEMQTLEWDRMHWRVNDAGQPEDIFLACEKNGCIIRNHEVKKMLDGHEWRPTAEPKHPNKRSYWLNGLYLPPGGTTWADIITEYLAAKAVPEKMKTWENVRLARPYKETVNDLSAEDLRAFAEPYPLGRIPADALVLVAAADTQDDRQEIDLYAIGPGEQMWHIERHTINHEPGSHQWTREMDDYLLVKSWPHELGGELRIRAVNIDSGGHYTQAIYNYCRTRRAKGVVPIKGANQRQAEIMSGTRKVDVNIQGRVIKSGVTLWRIGTQSAKSLLHRRLTTEPTAPGRIHYSHNLPLSFFEELTAEKLNRRYVNGYPVYEWVNTPGARNEAFDNLVYAYHATLRLGCHKWSDARWQQLRDELMASCQQSLFAPGPTTPTPAPGKRPDNNNGFTETRPGW